VAQAAPAGKPAQTTYARHRATCPSGLLYGRSQPEDFDLAPSREGSLTTPASADRPGRLRGIALMTLAVGSFALLDALAKLLGNHMHPMQIVWARYLSALVVLLIIFNPLRDRTVLVTRRPWAQALRSALLFASTAANFIALQHLQLDQTTALSFTTPVLVALLAGPLLGEWIGARRLAAVIVGFVGVLVVTQPWAGPIHWAIGLSLAGTTCYALYNLLTRHIGTADSAATTSIYSVAFGALVASLLVPAFWTAPASALIVVGMIALGFLGALGHWFLILAHQAAPAPVVDPFIYTQIVWMILLGFLVFGDVPAANTLVGAAIVIASGLYILSRERTAGAAK